MKLLAPILTFLAGCGNAAFAATPDEEFEDGMRFYLKQCAELKEIRTAAIEKQIDEANAALKRARTEKEKRDLRGKLRIAKQALAEIDADPKIQPELGRAAGVVGLVLERGQIGRLPSRDPLTVVAIRSPTEGICELEHSEPRGFVAGVNGGVRQVGPPLVYRAKLLLKGIDTAGWHRKESPPMRPKGLFRIVGRSDDAFVLEPFDATAKK